MIEPTTKQVDRAVQAMLASANDPEGMAAGREVYIIPTGENASPMLQMFAVWLHFVATPANDLGINMRDLKERLAEWSGLIDALGAGIYDWDDFCEALEDDTPFRAIHPYSDNDQ